MAEAKSTDWFRWLLWRLRPVLRLVRNLRGSPSAIAGGFSMGLFLALTPTVGVQILMAIFLATLFKVSRPAALLSVLVTNPVTVPPIFTFNYWVGSFFFSGPSVREVYSHFLGIAAQMARLNFWEVGALMKTFLQAGQDMLLPLVFGSLLVATIAAILSYALLLRLFRFLHQRRDRKTRKRESRSRVKPKAADAN